MGNKISRDLEWLIRQSAITPEVVEAYRSGPNWVGFDSEFGYARRDFLGVPGKATLITAMDGSNVLSTSQPHGARTSFVYAHRRPRINVYGNSFTECTQVNDGETWQEYLAAHLGEPIGNYGVGGYGVYQAYRRMIREETTDHGADYIILYIWGDDPVRSLLRSRWTSLSMHVDTTVTSGQTAFVGGSWPHLELDLDTGDFVEMDSAFSSPSDLLRLTDPDWLISQEIGDVALELMMFSSGVIDHLDRERVDKLSAALDYRFDWSKPGSANAASERAPLLHTRPGTRRDMTLQSQAGELLNRYAQSATVFVLERALEFASRQRKRLMVLLNMTAAFGAIHESPSLENRTDSPIIEFCSERHVPLFDMNEVHTRAWSELNGRLKQPQTYRDYLGPYLVDGAGHYNPQGNHLFAYALKDAIVDWLDPRPIIYSQQDASSFDFAPYLGASWAYNPAEDTDPIAPGESKSSG